MSLLDEVREQGRRAGYEEAKADMADLIDRAVAYTLTYAGHKVRGRIHANALSHMRAMIKALKPKRKHIG